MNICDNSLLRAEAFLNAADKAAIRHHDAHVSAQSELTIAKIEWAKEPAGETWMQRRARIIPNVSQSRVDNVIAGRFSKIAQDTRALSPEEYEAALKNMAEAHGLPYRTLEEREAYAKELVEVMAARKREQLATNKAAAAEIVAATLPEKTETQAEYDRERRKEAAAIQVANGGAPVQARAPRAVVPVEAPAPADTYDKARGDLVLLIVSKLHSLSMADLNDVNDQIDALTYPLRKI